MSEAAFFSIASVVIVSLVSFIGALSLVVRGVKIRKAVFYFVGFSAGALLGDVFFHLLPEAVENIGFSMEISFFVLSGIIMSFIVEKIIHWQHCHVPPSKSHVHTFAYMNLFGDAIHNFIDGLIIVASYAVSIPVGIATTLAVIFHEIPQEIGDFGVLIHGGFKPRKALFYNFISAVFAVMGALIGLAIASYLENSMFYIASFAAGGFLYIAGADLIPELHKKFTVKSSIVQLLTILLGIAVMYGLLFLD